MSETTIEKPKIILVFGYPGAGKSTLCLNIERDFGFTHLSVSRLLNDERQKPESEYGELIDKHMKDGTMPDEITCELIEIAMKNAETNRFIIEGYPQNKENLDFWKKRIGEKVDILFVIYLDCSENHCLARCLYREGEGRDDPDDTLNSIKERLSTFNNTTLPIVNYYKIFGIVKTIDANKPIELVFQDIKDVLARIWCK